MTQPLADERRAGRMAAQVVFLRRGLIAAGLLIAALIVVNVILARALVQRRAASAIFLDGKKVCLVRSERDAEWVLARLRELKRRSFAGEITFKEHWEDKAWPADGEQVLSREAAVKLLGPKLHALAAAWAIQVGGQDRAYMTAQELTEQVKQGLMSHYVAPGDQVVEQKIAGWTVAKVQADPSQLSDQVGRTVEALLKAKNEAQSYRVRPGDTTEGIARRFGMTHQQLLDLNPALRGRVLRAGETIKVAGAGPVVVVVTTKEEVKDVPYTLPRQTVEVAELPKGRRQEVPGAPGIKRVTKRVVYDNDQPRPRAQVVKEEIIKPAQPGRVLIGTGPATPPQ